MRGYTVLGLITSAVNLPYMLYFVEGYRYFGVTGRLFPMLNRQWALSCNVAPIILHHSPALWRRNEFSFGGYGPGSWDGSSPVGSRGEAPVKCLGDLQIFTAETIKIWKFRTLTSWFLTSMFRGGRG